MKEKLITLAGVSLQRGSVHDKCNPEEAPVGFFAVSKSIAGHPDGRNICKSCDWRKTCQHPETDFLAYGHRCMSHPVVALRDGKTYQRDDKCSVVFKKKKE
jgi:hypothetical protein